MPLHLPLVLSRQLLELHQHPNVTPVRMMTVGTSLKHPNRQMLEKATGPLGWKLEKASCQVNLYRELSGTMFQSVFAFKKRELESKHINRAQAQRMSSLAQLNYGDVGLQHPSSRSVPRSGPYPISPRCFSVQQHLQKQPEKQSRQKTGHNLWLFSFAKLWTAWRQADTPPPPPPSVFFFFFFVKI